MLRHVEQAGNEAASGGRVKSETLWEDDDFVLSRRASDSRQPSLLVNTPVPLFRQTRFA